MKTVLILAALGFVGGVLSSIFFGFSVKSVEFWLLMILIIIGFIMGFILGKSDKE